MGIKPGGSSAEGTALPTGRSEHDGFINVLVIALLVDAHIFSFSRSSFLAPPLAVN